jgi:hypothetical protein
MMSASSIVTNGQVASFREGGSKALTCDDLVAGAGLNLRSLDAIGGCPGLLQLSGSFGTSGFLRRIPIRRLRRVRSISGQLPIVSDDFSMTTQIPRRRRVWVRTEATRRPTGAMAPGHLPGTQT